ncbi:MAG: flavin reductase family protein [Cypionkella sp.]|uniref:flavin reductase family protein n=1 Tax=Cypionkella sp. TaxID=2811411 RepID=UPI002ABA7650|nr:flavin reductase family protein [Cypionkella sp.]MDZ4311463.1 flavin reductase family protein [Cypionkella sp.]MDZ4391413.1 flavin reductase family protein [Cypionkella sp.]
MTLHATKPHSLTDDFRSSMRVAAASVSLVTARDESGGFHGMAVTSAASLSMEPPSMMVAVNRSASIFPVISRTGRFCLNLMNDDHGGLLECFSRSDMRERRFTPEHWAEGLGGLPTLRGALSVHVCTVAAAHDFGTHTVFFGQVDDVILPEPMAQNPAPIIWLNGTRRHLRAIA